MANSKIFIKYGVKFRAKLMRNLVPNNSITGEPIINATYAYRILDKYLDLNIKQGPCDRLLDMEGEEVVSGYYEVIGLYVYYIPVTKAKFNKDIKPIFVRKNNPTLI